MSKVSEIFKYSYFKNYKTHPYKILKQYLYNLNLFNPAFKEIKEI